MHSRLAPLVLVLAFVAPSGGHAAGPSIADVKRAPTVRHALRIAKRLPGVKAKLRRGERVQLATRAPTEGEISTGKFAAVYQNQSSAYAGAYASLYLGPGLFGAKARVSVLSVWAVPVYGHEGVVSREHVPGSVLHGTKAGVYELPIMPTPDNISMLLRERDHARQQGGDGSSWRLLPGTRARTISVPTWRDNRKKNGYVKELFSELTPQKIGEFLEGQLGSEGGS